MTPTNRCRKLVVALAISGALIVDPTEDLIAVFMAQLLPSRNLDLQLKFRAAVYQSIVKSEVASPRPALP